MPLLTNVSASPYVLGTLTPSAFLGAPLVAFMDGVTETHIVSWQGAGPPFPSYWSSTDPRWVAASSFADSLGAKINNSAPLIGLDINVPANLTTLFQVLGAQTKFYSPDVQRAFAYSAGGAPLFLPVSGPFLAMASSSAQFTAVNNATFDESAKYLRLSSSNLYGVGNWACGKNTATSPPVYPIFSSDVQRWVGGQSPQLLKLLDIWARGGPSVLSSYSYLQGLEATRPGISLKVHPAVVPYLLFVDA